MHLSACRAGVYSSSSVCRADEAESCILCCAAWPASSALVPVQLPKSLVLTTEPGQLDYEAGADVPETSVCIMNGADQKVTKGHLGGEKQVYHLCQRLWYCPTGIAHPKHHTEGECSAQSGCK